MILAFGNKARHGKDTCCNAIVSFYNDRRRLATVHGLRYNTYVKKVNFGDVLRKEVTAATENAGGTKELLKKGIIGEKGYISFPGWVIEEPNPDMTDPLLPYGKHPKILQWWGTEFRRSQDPDYWVKQWQKEVSGFKGIIVTGDLRFLNEAKAVKQAGGYTVNVTRMTSEGKPFVDSTRPSDHVSEIELDNYCWDFFIVASQGHAALTGEQAVSLAEYIGSLEKK
jgi:hypothetical protein